MSCDTEMSLVQWCDKLYPSHRVQKELMQVRTAIALMNSMIKSGEDHSATSEKIVSNAFEILDGK